MCPSVNTVQKYNQWLFFHGSMQIEKNDPENYHFFIISIVHLMYNANNDKLVMKNFNRHSSHGRHCSKRRELAPYAHSRGSHAFTHTFTSTQLQPLCAKRQLSYYRSWNQFFMLKVPEGIINPNIMQGVNSASRKPCSKGK